MEPSLMLFTQKGAASTNLLQPPPHLFDRYLQAEESQKGFKMLGTQTGHLTERTGGFVKTDVVWRGLDTKKELFYTKIYRNVTVH